MKLEIRIGIKGVGGEVWIDKSTQSGSVDETDQCDTALSDLTSDFEAMAGALHAMFGSALLRYRQQWEKWKEAQDKAAELEAERVRKEKEAAAAKAAEERAREEAAKQIPMWNGLPDPVPNWPEKSEEQAAGSAPGAAENTSSSDAVAT